MIQGTLFETASATMSKPNEKLEFPSNLLLLVDSLLNELGGYLEPLSTPERIEAINYVRSKLHGLSPFKDEPIDLVLWVPTDSVEANDYNPNKVAPPEMQLLAHSISLDGYTQPVVTWVDSDKENEAERREVVDGFHRNEIARTVEEVRARLFGYLPVTTVNQTRVDRGDRIAATIRHNRARGKHQVSSMSDIVVELKRRNWSDQKIGKELGMDPDEVLRLAQISGLAEMFADKEFSEAWESDDSTEWDGSVLDESEEISEDETPGQGSGET